MLYIKNKSKIEAIIIGGSAGSFPVVNKILEHIQPDYRLPTILCLHRLKDKREGFKEALQIKSSVPVTEPDDKSLIQPANAYVAPANYHLLIEDKEHFALSTTELVQYSRPSIDVMFESAADVYRENLLAILVSGANKDGAYGMKKVKSRGGITVVQEPSECSMRTMPEAAMKATKIDHILSLEQIIELIRYVH